MRFLELYLKAYGPFTDRIFDLSKGGQGLHLIYGPNEAGKTSALRAIRALLYGIHGQTLDNFVHNYRDLRIGARLRGDNGEEHVFWRRKGNKDTLLDANEDPIAESRMTRLLGGITEPVFLDAFGIDHTHLVAGGKTLLEGGGEVGESLFAAGLGSANLRDTLAGLDRECEEIFKGGAASKPKINRLLREHRRLTKATKDASLAGAAWTTRRETLEKAEAERDRLDRLLKVEKARLSQRERLMRALPRLAKRAERLASLQVLEEKGPVPDLRPDFAEERREAERALERSGEKARRAVSEIESIEELSAELDVAEDLLVRREEVQQLHLELARHQKAASDRIGLEGKRQQHETSATARLNDLRPGFDVKTMERPTLSVIEGKRIEELIDRHGALAATLDGATQTQTRRGRAHARLLDELMSRTEPLDAVLLREACDGARRSGDLDARLAELRDAEKDVEHEANLALSRLGLWDGTLEEAEALPIPDLSTIERSESEWDDTRSGLRDLAKRRKETEREVEGLAQELSALERGRAIPTEGDLTEARKRRQEGWRLVRRDWLDGEDVDEKAYDTERPLPDAYEYNVQRADTVSDDLRAGADRVASKAQLVARQEAAEARQIALEAEETLWTKKVEQTRETWVEIWDPLGVTPLAPREMRAWLDRHARLLERTGDLCRAKTQREKVSAAANQDHARILTALRTLDGSIGPEAFETLTALLDHAEAYVNGIEQEADELSGLRTRVESLEEEVEDARAERESAETALAEWEKKWAQALSPLDLGGGETPQQVRAVLQVLTDLQDDLRQEAQYANRIRAIERDETEFTERVTSIVDAVASDLAAEESHVSLRTLHLRVQAAVDENSERVRLEEQLAKWRREHEVEAEGAKEAQRLLDGLCEEAGAGDPSTLPALEGRAREAASLRTEVEGIEDDLVSEGKGVSLADLLAEAEAVDGDTLEAETDALAKAIEDLEEQRATVREQLGEARNALASIEGTAEAAHCAEEAESVASGIRSHAEHYVRLRLARAILQREIERYRRDNQAPLLQLASKIFARITCGSFSSLESSYEEDDKPVLLGIRPFGERLPVEGMSDGTREQLYLALRLASLEQHLEAGTAVPLVVDDLLLRSDEARSEAILKALADLSSRTQVLFFTHQHRHIEMARGLNRPTEVFVAELTPRSDPA